MISDAVIRPPGAMSPRLPGAISPRLPGAMSPDENHRHDSRLGPAITPAVPGTVLHHGVAGAKHLLGAVVQFQDYLTGENHLEVDGVGRMHPGVVWLHVAEQARQLVLHLRERRLEVQLARCR